MKMFLEKLSCKPLVTTIFYKKKTLIKQLLLRLFLSEFTFFWETQMIKVSSEGTDHW